MTGNGALPASAAFQEELDREREALRSFPAGMQIMRPDGQRPDSGTEAAPETPGSPRPRAVLDFPERSKKAAVCRISPPAVSRPFWRFSSEYKIFSAGW